jgi:hypothetical protein
MGRKRTRYYPVAIPSPEHHSLAHAEIVQASNSWKRKGQSSSTDAARMSFIEVSESRTLGDSAKVGWIRDASFALVEPLKLFSLFRNHRK